MLLVVTEPKDPHLVFLEPKLRGRKLRSLVFNPRDFPSRATLSAQCGRSSGELALELSCPAGRCRLDEVRSIWYRRPEPVEAGPRVTDTAARTFATEEAKALVEDVWHLLDCKWVPGPRGAVREAGHKLRQLRLARAVGLSIPPTLVTNDPAAVLDFYRSHDGNVISKPVAGALRESLPGFVRYTQLASGRDITSVHAVRHAPAVFQAYVRKRVELRVTVVADRVFAAEIHSQATARTQVDWRQYDHRNTPYFVHALPADVAAACRELVRRLGLVFGALDLVLTPEGDYVFLEVNPNGQWGWIEELTGLPISDALCDVFEEAAA